MKHRSHFIALSVLVIVGFVLVLAPAAAQDDTPTLVIWADETRAGPIQEIGQAFAEEFGVEIVVQELGFGDIRDQFKIAGPAGEGPDIIIGAHDWIGELASNGLLASINLGDQADEFAEAAITAFTWNGALVGMPYATENVALFRNTELVAEAPATWDDVAAISEELIASGASRFGFVLQEADPFHWFGIQTAFGGYVFGTDELGQYNPQDVGIDSEGSIAALQWLQDNIEAGIIPSGIDTDTMRTLFETGDAAMVITGPWDLGRFRDSGVPFAISPIPGQGENATGSPFLGVQGFMVSAFSENPLLAETFLTEFIATQESMQAIFDAGDRPSAYLPVLENTESEDLAAFGAAGENALPMPAIPEMSAVWGAWSDAITLVFNGEVNAPQAFTTAAEQIRSTIAGEDS